MSIKKGSTAIVDRYKGSQLVERVYKGQTKIFDAYTDVSGTLPLSFTARAQHALTNYRLYGTSEGAGEQTENLFDKDAKDTNKGYIENQTLFDDGTTGNTPSFSVSEYIPISPNTDYYLKWVYRSSSNTSFCLYDSNKNYLSGAKYSSYGEVDGGTFNSGNAVYMRFSIRNSAINSTMLTEGSSAPASYIPYGYKIPLTVESGEQIDSYNLYIGDTKLGVEEYLDYGEQKVYKTKYDYTWIEKYTVQSTNNVRFYMKWDTNELSNYDGIGVLLAVTKIDELTPDNAYMDYSVPANLWSGGELTTYLTATNGISTRPYVIIDGERYYSETIASDYAEVNSAPNQTIEYDRPFVLIPTTPPSPLPAITAYKGENTLSSTETVGSVTVTGRISEIPEP